MHGRLAEREIVLLGVGHTNAHVLRMWGMKPIADARLTCVSNFPVATYSGMLPGVLAGQYPVERMQIDLVRLCAAHRARLIIDEVTGLDVDRRELLFAQRSPVPFDVLSIGIGSVPNRAGVAATDDAVVPIKPMQTFLSRLELRLRQCAERSSRAPLNVVVVGGGAGGCEIAFCLRTRLQQMRGDAPFLIRLIQAGETLVPGTRPGTAELVRRTLVAQGIDVRLECRVLEAAQGTVRLTGGEEIPADLVLWAAGASPPPLLEKLPLPKDERGFLLVRPTLQTTADAPIFVVGDTATLADRPTPKAGVFAVRQAPVLWNNIASLLDHRRLDEFQPQRDFLKLFNTGDGRAIAEWKGLRLHDRLAWWLKDAIDGRFMDKYQNYQPMPMPAATTTRERAATPMRCAGCGGKVGGRVLAAALERLPTQQNKFVAMGLSASDDAAVILPPRPALALTADFFAAPLDDSFLVGRIAALNAASDAFAMASEPIAALALLGIPEGPARRQEELLFALLAGAAHELNHMGAALVGGHTIESPQLTIGFAIAADPGDRPPWTKAGLRDGDHLVLTKALGTGILLASHMRAQCRAEWMCEMVASMLQSNQIAARVLRDFDVAAATDVTGFGLAGHLLEMLRASNVGCRLGLAAIPLLPGVESLLDEQIESTLAPANRAFASELQVAPDLASTAPFAALFDPQTSGGLLAGVRASDVEAIVARLAAEGVRTRVIGVVTADDPVTIRVVDSWAIRSGTPAQSAAHGSDDARG